MPKALTRYGAGLIAIAYIALSLAWISGSDHLVSLLATGPDDLTFLQTVKGTAFVLLTGIGLFCLIRLHERRLTGRQTEAERRIRTILDNSTAIILLVEPSSLRLVDVNAAGRAAFKIGGGIPPDATLMSVLKPRRITTGPEESGLRALVADAVDKGSAATEWRTVDATGRDVVYEVRLSSVALFGASLVQVALWDSTDSNIVDTVLRDLSDALADKVGAQFHESLALTLTRALGVKHAFIAQSAQGRDNVLRTTALVRNHAICDNQTLELGDVLGDEFMGRTEPLVIDGNETCVVQHETLGLGPVRGHAATVLSSARGSPLGVLAVFHHQPLRNPGLVANVLKLAAGRAAAELERMRAEQAQAESEARFRQFASASSDWLWEQDADYRFTYFSDGWSEAAGCPQNYALGRTRWELARVDVDSEPAWKEHKQTLDARLPFSDFVYRLRVPDGSIRHWRTDGVPVYDSAGRFSGYRGTAADETEKMEALNRARQAQDRLLDAIQSLPVGFALFDANDRLSLLNDRYRDRGGRTQAPAALGSRFDDLVRQTVDKTPLHPSMGDPWLWTDLRIERHRNLPSSEEVQFADGSFIDIHEYPTSEGGSVLLWTDITERKLMETALRNSEEHFRSMISEASHGILVHSGKQVHYCNDALAQMFGFDSVDEVLALEDIAVLVDEADRDRLARYTIDRQAGRPVPTEYEFTGVRNDGSKITIQIRVVRVPWDGGYAICANLIDITERKGIEAALARSENEFRDLVEGSVQGVVIHTDNELRFANRAAAAIFGYQSTDDLIELGTVDRLLGDAARAGLLHRDDGTEAVEAQARRRDGSPLVLELLVRRVHWLGDPSTQITMMDITSRKQAETVLRRSQRMEAIGQLTGGIAHDFNNLLGIITGNLQLAERRIDGDSQLAPRIASALKAAARGSRLTRRLLSLSSQESRQGTPTDANRALAGIEEMLARSLTSTIALEVRPDPSLWLTEIDAGELEDAVLNLALNARNAMPDGGRITIAASNLTIAQQDPVPAAQVPAPGDYVVVSVRDEGTGMPPEVLEKAFEPFFTTRSSDQGSGLGLSMVYSFAKRYRGDVQIRSEVGRGTTVRIFLPRSSAEAAAVDAVDAHSADEPGGSGTILVVDDEPELVDLAATMVRDLGFSALTARNGREALEILREPRGKRVDLVFSDVVMPGGISGFDLANRIRSDHPDVRILLTSGFPGRQPNGPTDDPLLQTMLAKPYDRATLAQAVTAAIVSRH